MENFKKKKRKHQQNKKYIQYQSSTLIQKLSLKIIRPPKVQYNPQQLFIPLILLPKLIHKSVNIPFNLSIYMPTIQQKSLRYIILFLHENMGNKISSLFLLEYLPQNVGLACFDFAGCGNRTKKYLTLGINEAKQINEVIDYLKKKVSKVVCWGRSMGATSILYSKLNCDLIILDSPFSNFQQVLLQISKKKFFYLPTCLIKIAKICVCKMVEKDIFLKIGLKFEDLNVLKYLENSDNNNQNSPTVLFVCSDEDQLISSSHSFRLYDAYKGKNKQICMLSGNHNAVRTKDEIRIIFDFIQAHIKSQFTYPAAKKVQISGKITYNFEQFETSQSFIRQTKLEIM